MTGKADWQQLERQRAATRSRYPTPLEEWNHEHSALLKDFYAHRAAVEVIQAQHFDGHPILFLAVEAELTETARAIEIAVATANEYLRSQARLLDGQAEHHHAETDGGTGENNLAIARESIKASANGQWAAAIAEKWLQDASFEAIESDAEQWERWREEHGEDE